MMGYSISFRPPHTHTLPHTQNTAPTCIYLQVTLTLPKYNVLLTLNRLQCSLGFK